MEDHTSILMDDSVTKMSLMYNPKLTLMRGLSYIPYSGEFLRGPIFAVFVDSRTMHNGHDCLCHLNLNPQNVC